MNKQIKHKIINDIEHKLCKKCRKHKTLDCFNRSTYTLDKLTQTCKDCLSKGNKRGRPCGYIMNEKSKKGISNKLKNRILPETHKKKIANSMIGNKNKDKEGLSGFSNLKQTERPVTYKTYATQLNWCEKVRQSPENIKILEVKCAYCGQWFIPTRAEVRSRILAITGKIGGESCFYCSEKCKADCPLYKQVNWPKGFKKTISNKTN